MVVSRALTKLGFSRHRQLRRLWTGAFSCSTRISGRNVGTMLAPRRSCPVRMVSSTAPVSGMSFLDKLFGRTAEENPENADNERIAASALEQQNGANSEALNESVPEGAIEEAGSSEAIAENQEVMYENSPEYVAQESDGACIVGAESGIGETSQGYAEEGVSAVEGEGYVVQHEAAGFEGNAAEGEAAAALLDASENAADVQKGVLEEASNPAEVLEASPEEHAMQDVAEVRKVEQGVLEGNQKAAYEKDLEPEVMKEAGVQVSEGIGAAVENVAAAAAAAGLAVSKPSSEPKQTSDSKPDTVVTSKAATSEAKLTSASDTVVTPKAATSEAKPTSASKSDTSPKPTVTPKATTVQTSEAKPETSSNPNPKAAASPETPYTKLADATIKPSSKPAKKPSPTKPNAEVAADATPVLDFLRERLKNPNSTSDTTPAAAAAPEPPPKLKLSLSTVQKTNAAIGSILDSMDTKSGKSPSIFDALNMKHEEPTSTPSLKLSISASNPAEPTPMDTQALLAEINTRLTDGKHSEAAKLFETWKGTVNPVTLEANKPDRGLYNLYMQAKVKTGAHFKEINEVLSEMEKAGLPRDLAGYNILIRSLYRTDPSLNRSSEAEAILERMEKDDSNAQPDGDSYNLVVVLCALERKTVSAFKYMKTMIDKGFEPSRTTVNEVLLAAARTHQTQMGASLLKDLKASGKPLPMLNTCAELLMAASEVDDAECARLALASISERPMAKFGPKMIMDEGTLISTIGTAARTGDTVLANKAWEAICNHTRSLGRVPSSEAFLSRIHALTMSNATLGAALKAAWEFEGCHKNDTGSEVFSPFTSLKSLSTACSRGGASALDAAYYKIEEAHTKKQGVALASLNCIILGCSNLWDSERAFQTFEAIENVFGLRPDLHSCNALLHALGRTKMTEDAMKVFDYIKEAGFTPNDWTYMLLAEAHVVNHDATAALDTLQTMIDAGLRPLRQTTSKVWTRLKQYEDSEGLERLKQMESQLNYRHLYFANNRRKFLLELVRS